MRQDARDPLVGNAEWLPLCTVEHDVDSQTHAASSAQTLGMPTPARRCRCMHDSCRLEMLVAARARAEEASEDYALIIDEADLVARQRVLTETVQELGDLTGHPIVLVGNADLASRLDMHLGFLRRIWELVEFKPATIRDVDNLARELCRYKISDDLALWLRKASGGRICALERSLRRIESIVQDSPDGSLICLADMAGRELARDRSHRPIRVPNPQPELRVVR